MSEARFTGTFDASVRPNHIGDQIFGASVEAPPKQIGKDLTTIVLTVED